MEIVWDERKRLVNLDKHGMNFASLDLDFFERAVILPAKKWRLMAVGRLDGVVTVVFIKLGTEALSVLSMRPASKGERRLV
jgi:uncharacterized DUF497 family protein